MTSSDWQARLDWFFKGAEAYLSSSIGLRHYLTVAVFLALAAGFEAASRKDWLRRYGSKGFRIDLTYYFFYYSGLYHLLVLMWVYKGVMWLIVTYAPWLQLKLLQDLSAPLQFFIIMVVVDMIGYWIHRFRHANQYLWAFHSVHHSQTRLTGISFFRGHIVDATIDRLWNFIPVQILMGVSLTVWLWVDIVLVTYVLLQHTGWNWSFGPIGRLAVSPAFHRLHHARSGRYQSCNFSGTFSFWDDLFGTALRKALPPPVYGLSGNPVPETICGQFVYPFARIFHGLRTRTVSPSTDIPPVKRNSGSTV